LVLEQPPFVSNFLAFLIAGLSSVPKFLNYLYILSNIANLRKSFKMAVMVMGEVFLAGSPFLD
jgi:hypothetical protein